MKKRLLKTSNLAEIRPLHVSSGESVKRFLQLKKFFLEEERYTLFAEPALKGKSVEWYTELEGGKLQYYSTHPDPEKEQIKKLLKRQVNQLFQHAFRFGSEKDKAFSILESCIEIPSLDNICVLEKTGAIPHIILTEWGFIYDQFQAQSNIIKNLIPLKVFDVELFTKFMDGSIADQEEVSIVIDGHTVQRRSNSAGRIELEDIPFDSVIKVYQRNENGFAVNEQKFILGSQYQFDYYLGDESCYDLEVHVVDPQGKPLTGVEVQFFGKNSAGPLFTSQDGKVVFSALSPVAGAELHAIYDEQTERRLLAPSEIKGGNIRLVFNKPEPLQPPLVQPPIVVDIRSTKENTQLTLRTCNLFRRPLREANVEFALEGTVYKAKSNENGLAHFTALPAETEISYRGIHRQKRGTGKLWLNREHNQAELVLKSKWWWLPLLLPLLLFLLLFLPEKKLIFEVIDQESNAKLEGARVLVAGPGGSVILLTNDLGQVVIPDSLLGKKTAVLTLIASKDCYLDTEQTKTIGEYLANDTVNRLALENKRVDLKALVLNGDLQTPISGVKVTLLENGKTTQSSITAENGQFVFSSQISCARVLLHLEKDGFYSRDVGEDVLRYLQALEKIELFPLPLPCDGVVNRGTIEDRKTEYSITSTDGTFTISYDFLNQPDEMIVYCGMAEAIDSASIIWQSRGKISGSGNVNLTAGSCPARVITVRIIGTESGTHWSYRVICN